MLAPSLQPLAITIAATVIALTGFGVLNLLGIRESARVTVVFAVVAALGQLLVVVAVAVHLGPAGIGHSIAVLGRGPHLGPLNLITGYAAAFLAFSGLESIAQLAPAMREPRRTVSGRAMAIVVGSMLVTSPLLTLWSTTLLEPHSDPNQYISLLGGYAAGRVLASFVAPTGALLLVFASNTAIIGSYHVFVALSRMGFLPRTVEAVNRWRKTPHVAIGLAVGFPVAIVVAAGGSTTILGDLYAFGLLGAFTLTCVGLDIVRWHDQTRRRTLLAHRAMRSAWPPRCWCSRRGRPTWSPSRWRQRSGAGSRCWALASRSSPTG